MAAEELQTRALSAGGLHRLAVHVGGDLGRLQRAGVLEIATIFKALGKVGLVDDLQVLASAGLGRLGQLWADDGFGGVDLETLGNLSGALLPLVRSPRLRRHRGQALEFLVALQPVIAHKVGVYRAGVATAPDGRFGTRNPALTMFQILKAYRVVATMVDRHGRIGTGAEVGQGRDLLAWWEATLEENRKLIEDDLSTHSWNLIAQMYWMSGCRPITSTSCTTRWGECLGLSLLPGCWRRWRMSRHRRRGVLAC
jgi:hypothetical protein